MYTTSAAVEQHVGRTFTALQYAEADALLPAADAWINARLPYSFPQTTLITDELHTVFGPYLYLDRSPITSVTTVKVRPPSIGAADSTLTLASTWELLSTSRGLIRLYGYAGWEARVTYTPAVATDARLSLAAKKLVAFWMRPLLDGVSGDVQSYSIGQELQVTFKQGGASSKALGVPDDVVALVDSINPVVWAFA